MNADKKKIIRVMIPIYVINKESEKYIITEKSFKYWVNLKNLVKDELIMDFTIMGSEGALSKDLTLKYFNNTDSYIEFDQGGIDYFNRENSTATLNYVVGKKAKVGYDICKTHDPDLIIIIKSNHFISYDWLKFVIDDNNNNKFYGLSLTGNTFILSTLTSDNKIDHSNMYIWDLRKEQPQEQIDACLLALPRNIYNKFDINPFTPTETHMCDQLKNIGYYPVLTNNFYIFNIKSNDESTNVTSFSFIKSINITPIETFDNNSLQMCELYDLIHPENLFKINQKSFLIKDKSIEEQNFIIKLVNDIILINSL